MNHPVAGLVLVLMAALSPGLAFGAPQSAVPERAVSEAERLNLIAAREAQLNAARVRGAAEVARLQARLIEAREALVADLAARDPAYAEEITVFRREVTDIASTPEGAAALARYNAGDRSGAIATLDRLRQARGEARTAQADLESAAEARQIATLALDARGKRDPAFDTGAVIARFEEVVRLDPLQPDDWRRLAALYRDAGRSADAETADARVVALSRSDAGRP
jgi:DNA-binding SARP family transcriptional activator